jgi:hypothetical protein
LQSFEQELCFKNISKNCRKRGIILSQLERKGRKMTLKKALKMDFLIEKWKILSNEKFIKF